MSFDENCWEKYRDACLKPGTPEVEVNYQRFAVYAGAAGVLTLLNEAREKNGFSGKGGVIDALDSLSEDVEQVIRQIGANLPR